MKWLYVLLVSILDILIAACVAWFAEAGSQLPAFGMVLAVLWLLPLPIGIWALIRYWTIYHLVMKKRMARAYSVQFHRFDFPKADAFFDADQYLSHIMDDEETPKKAKLKAAALVGELAAYREMHPFTVGFAAGLAFQDAMANFRPDPRPFATRATETMDFFNVR
ncbi:MULTISPECIES: hypothetical protein [unclassified Rhizobium]|uniref:hypothetical protein n=1 Tax=unclassified Rhizobium TaxID=2613769 RepID=UPI0007EA3701|nr:MULTISPECIES: hypothetical protein [unclassified Rhizobium]ANM10383.1 hypothetical protein AMK05_CH01997 [Rhizobium sp. N324]ANM16868.1 hypothetical protein AMK06_CH01966 [Rhizobium sp. N541]ANM23253.1 hypothetical protein AMK07_CH01963 [Rhizobium sp. N941]